jgi:hypothetical protein
MVFQKAVLPTKRFATAPRHAVVQSATTSERFLIMLCLLVPGSVTLLRECLTASGNSTGKWFLAGVSAFVVYEAGSPCEALLTDRTHERSLWLDILGCRCWQERRRIENRQIFFRRLLDAKLCLRKWKVPQIWHESLVLRLRSLAILQTLTGPALVTEREVTRPGYTSATTFTDRGSRNCSRAIRCKIRV